uniref:Uncharacterized protein n=1 Tax=Rhizophora mucronata TaxID=61149 RepID=A0A2P2QZI4_RHIMU
MGPVRNGKPGIETAPTQSMVMILPCPIH